MCPIGFVQANAGKDNRPHEERQGSAAGKLTLRQYDGFMTIEKASSDARLVAALKALGDENRLQMVRMLRDKGSEMNCGEIGEHLDLNKSTVSYHFRILREAGLTSTRREGQNKFVSLNSDVFGDLVPGFLESL